MRALIEAGTDINKADDEGGMPLYNAIFKGHVAMVRALIVAGADVNMSVLSITPLGIAAAHKGYEGIVQMLRDAGARGRY